MTFSKTLRHAAIASALLAASPALAVDIDNTNGTTPMASSYQPFGSPNTATYGIVFSGQAGDTVLNSFTMFLTGGSGTGTLNFRGYIGAWNGLRATSILFTSSTVAKSVNGAEAFQFNTGNLAITPGSQYVAFISTSDLGTQGTRTFEYGAVNGTADARLSFAFVNNGTNFAALTGGNWDSTNNVQGAFRADFSTGGAVPEPGSWAMMIAGVGAVGFAARRRRKTAVRVRFA